MIWSRLLKTALSLLGFLAVTTAVSAAEFTFIPASEFDTTRFPIQDVEGFIVEADVIRIEGDIAPGDAERLDAFIRKQPGRAEYWGMTVLSMNSEGGDFRAGIQLGSYIHQNGNFVTLVDRDSVCLSACAVAFMMGYQYHEEIGPFLARYVEAGGKLGFHRPFMGKVLDFDPTVFEGLPQAEIDAFMTAEYALFYDLANQLIQEMLAVNVDAWKNELLVPMLLATADAEGRPSFVYMETVGQAIEWEIQVIGVKPPRKRTRRDHLTEVWWSCYNAAWPELFNMGWEDADDFDPMANGLYWLERESADEYGFTYDVTIFELTGDGCKVNYDKDGSYISAIGHGVGLAEAQLRKGVGLINLYKPTTRLLEITTEGRSRSISDRALVRRLDARKGVCRVLVDRDPIATERCGHTASRDPETQIRTHTFSVPGDRVLTFVGTDEGGTLDGAPVNYRSTDQNNLNHDFCLDQVLGNRSLCFSLE